MNQTIDPMNLIIPNLFLGNMEAGFNPKFLRDKGIRAVLQVCQTPPNIQPVHTINRWIIPVPDIPSTQLLPYFQYTCNWIQHQLRAGNPVLVHCMAGVSRSATVIIAFLMWAFNWNLEQAAMYVRQRRWVIYPNQGFIQQLRQWEKYLSQKNRKK